MALRAVSIQDRAVDVAPSVPHLYGGRDRFMTDLTQRSPCCIATPDLPKGKVSTASAMRIGKDRFELAWHARYAAQTGCA